MKTIFAVMAVCLCLITGSISYAEETTLNEPSATPMEWTKFGINFSGDTVYLLKSGKFAAGLGLSPVTFVNGTFELRVEYVNQLTGDLFATDMAGLFVQADIIKAIKLIPNSQWLIPETGLKLGIGYMADIENLSEGEPALLISIVKLF